MMIDKINQFLGTKYFMRFFPDDRTLIIYEPILVEDLIWIRKLENFKIKNIIVKGKPI